MAVDKKYRDEQDLERYGVWVKTGPEGIVPTNPDSIELMHIEDSDQEGLLITEEEERLLGEMEEAAMPEFGGPFADQDEIINEEPAAMPGSTELLRRIEDDLVALRAEIRQLKDELTGPRVPAVAASDEQNGGFFDEEEDETIALTGDELNNILDSAEMMEHEAEAPAEPAEEAAAVTANEEDNEEDESIEINLSDIGDEPPLRDEGPAVEEDPGIAILGSSDFDEDGDPDSIEINITGADTELNLDEAEDLPKEASSPAGEDFGEPIVSIDDITGDEDGFEEITDLDDFGVEETAAETPEPEAEQIIAYRPKAAIPVESILEDDDFDDGEEVHIDLSGVEDEFAPADDAAAADLNMEEISMDDFGIGEDEDETEVPAAIETEDTLIEEINLEEIEDLGTGEVDNLPGGDAKDLDEGFSGEELPVEALESEEEFVMEDPVDDFAEEFTLSEDIPESLDPEPPETFGEPSADDPETDESVEINPEDLSDDSGEPEVDVEEPLFEKEPPETDDDFDIPKDILEVEDEDEIVMDDFGLEEDPFSDMPEETEGAAEEPQDEDLPVIELEDDGDLEIAIDDMEVEEEDAFNEVEIEMEDLPLEESLEPGDTEDEVILQDFGMASDMELEEDPAIEEEAEEIIIEDLDSEENEEGMFLDKIDLTHPSDEPMDLNEAIESIETAETFSIDEESESEPGLEDDFTELPGTEEVDMASLEALASMSDEPVQAPAEELSEEPEPQGASSELEALPGDLKEEIRDVLKYMDQLLESLPDDKIQEFARSEHFEVYKKIFEELGISD